MKCNNETNIPSCFDTTLHLEMDWRMGERPSLSPTEVDCWGNACIIMFIFDLLAVDNDAQLLCARP